MPSVTVPPKMLLTTQRRAFLPTHQGQSCLTAADCNLLVKSAKLICGEVSPNVIDSEPAAVPRPLATVSSSKTSW